jgi:hypothetical protein
MYSVPLGMMFGADVSINLISTPTFIFSALTVRYASSLLASTFASKLNLAESKSGLILLFPRSMIASFFGNVVGGLVVAVPAVYYYLRDYDAGGLRTAEQGDSIRHHQSFGSKGSSNGDAETKQHQ